MYRTWDFFCFTWPNVSIRKGYIWYLVLLRFSMSKSDVCYLVFLGFYILSIRLDLPGTVLHE